MSENRCANCHEPLVMTSHEEMQKEFDELFPGDEDEKVVVCDDCFLMLMSNPCVQEERRSRGYPAWQKPNKMGWQ